MRKFKIWLAEYLHRLADRIVLDKGPTYTVSVYHSNDFRRRHLIPFLKRSGILAYSHESPRRQRAIAAFKKAANAPAQSEYHNV